MAHEGLMLVLEGRFNKRIGRRICLMIFDLLPLPPKRRLTEQPVALAGKRLELGADGHVKSFLSSLVTCCPVKPAPPGFHYYPLGLRS